VIEVIEVINTAPSEKIGGNFERKNGVHRHKRIPSTSPAGAQYLGNQAESATKQDTILFYLQLIDRGVAVSEGAYKPKRAFFHMAVSRQLRGVTM
jgi:hypothetical protein